MYNAFDKNKCILMIFLFKSFESLEMMFAALRNKYSECFMHTDVAEFYVACIFSLQALTEIFDLIIS